MSMFFNNLSDQIGMNRVRKEEVLGGGGGGGGGVLLIERVSRM